MPREARGGQPAAGESFIMVYDDKAGTFLCNYSPHLLIIFYLA